MVSGIRNIVYILVIQLEKYDVKNISEISRHTQKHMSWRRPRNYLVDLIESQHGISRTPYVVTKFCTDCHKKLLHYFVIKIAEPYSG